MAVSSPESCATATETLVSKACGNDEPEVRSWFRDYAQICNDLQNFSRVVIGFLVPTASIGKIARTIL